MEISKIENGIYEITKPTTFGVTIIVLTLDELDEINNFVEKSR